MEIRDFTLFLGGYMRTSYSVFWDKGELVYLVVPERFQFDGAREERLRPTSGQWDAFFEACRTINIFSLARRYERPDILNGTQWGITIETDSFRFRSGGSNAYPQATFGRDRLIYLDPLIPFWKAASELLGGREFGS